jgi:hypothetical protein
MKKQCDTKCCIILTETCQRFKYLIKGFSKGFFFSIKRVRLSDKISKTILAKLYL